MHFGTILGSGEICKFIRVKKGTFSAKITDLPKLLPSNFGRRCPERLKTVFWSTNINYCHHKTFHGRTEFSVVFQKSWVGPFPLQHFSLGFSQVCCGLLKSPMSLVKWPSPPSEPISPRQRRHMDKRARLERRTEKFFTTFLKSREFFGCFDCYLKSFRKNRWFC